MKCPLMVSGYRDRTLDPMRPATDCLKEECAWWEKEGEGCAVMLLGLQVGTVCDQLTELLEKMPHEGQFRK